MRILLICALLLAAAFLSNAEWSEQFTIAVADEQLRPIPDASVYAVYQLNSRDGLVKTRPKKTDANGEVNFTLFNNEFNTADSNKNYNVYASFGNESKTISMVAGAGHPKVIVMYLRAYYLYVRVTDHRNLPLFANVSVGSKTIETDARGQAFFQVPYGSSTIKVARGGLTIPISVDVTNDSVQEVQIKNYDLTVRVLDENGKPLVANVAVGGDSKKTDAKGEAQFGSIVDSAVEAVVSYKQVNRSQAVDLDVESEIEFVMDLTPPEIRDIGVKVEDGIGRVTVYAQDPGTRASGLSKNEGDIKVKYTISSVDAEVAAYPVGYNLYAAEIPSQPEGTSVQLTISVADADGNIATNSTAYVVRSSGGGGTAPPPEPKPLPTPLPTPTSQQSFPIDPMLLGAALAVVVLLAGAFYYIRKKQEEEGGTQGGNAGAAGGAGATGGSIQA
jgi:hypothetical protein